MSSANSLSSVDQLLGKCVEKRVTIPFLFSLSPNWRPRPNPNYEQSVDDRLDAWRLKYLHAS